MKFKIINIKKLREDKNRIWKMINEKRISPCDTGLLYYKSNTNDGCYRYHPFCDYCHCLSILDYIER